MTLTLTGNEPVVTMEYVAGRPVTYQRHASGTYYHQQTPVKVREILESYRNNHKRVRLFYGDTTTGRDWMEEHDVIGTIGRSMGPLKVPLLIGPRCDGGPALLDHCIVRIIDVATRCERWRHPSYVLPEITPGSPWSEEFPFAFYSEGHPVASFHTATKADRWLDFIAGRSMRP
ncbi:MAG TPA: hypothetical protein PLN91_00565 [Rhodanobacteraceae bacterium]|nr:hypothetical protein [Rhodanobacteraceae bacterium]